MQLIPSDRRPLSPRTMNESPTLMAGTVAAQAAALVKQVLK